MRNSTLSKKYNHNGGNKEYHIEPRSSCVTGQSLSLWFVQQHWKAVQSCHDKSGQSKEARYMLGSRIWQTCRLGLVQAMRERRHGVVSGESRMRTEAADEPVRNRCEIPSKTETDCIILFSLAA